MPWTAASAQLRRPSSWGLSRRSVLMAPSPPLHPFPLRSVKTAFKKIHPKSHLCLLENASHSCFSLLQISRRKKKNHSQI